MGPSIPKSYLFFFFNDTATTEIYTLSLHDALPISKDRRRAKVHRSGRQTFDTRDLDRVSGDRKSTRLNSSHVSSSYAVFCLKKKINDGYRVFLLLLICLTSDRQ